MVRLFVVDSVGSRQKEVIIVLELLLQELTVKLLTCLDLFIKSYGAEEGTFFSLEMEERFSLLVFPKLRNISFLSLIITRRFYIHEPNSFILIHKLFHNITKSFPIPFLPQFSLQFFI